MKTLNLIISFSIITFLFYLISCDIVDTKSGKFTDKQSNTDNNKEACSADTVRCTIPLSCNNGHGEHICLDLIDGNTKEEFNYALIRKVLVEQTGRDCDNNLYYCKYIVNGGNPYSMGCVLPWCNDSCSYTRSVCIDTYINVTYTGSVQFSYNNYSGASIELYETQAFCNFGEMERNDD